MLQDMDCNKIAVRVAAKMRDIKSQCDAFEYGLNRLDEFRKKANNHLEAAELAEDPDEDLDLAAAYEKRAEFEKREVAEMEQQLRNSLFFGTAGDQAARAQGLLKRFEESE